jgi:WD40 repeat protein
MAVPDTHPDSADLEAFALGRLDSASLTAIEEHLASCPTCEERVASSPGDSLIDLLRRAHALSARQAQTVTEAPAQAQTAPRSRLEHSAPISNYHFAISPDGKMATTAAEDKLARLWDLETGKERQRREPIDEPIATAGFFPDGTVCLSGKIPYRIWDIKAGTEVKKFDIGVSAWLPGGKQFINADNRFVHTRDA